MSRERIGIGLEHEVFNSSAHPEYVLKRPRFLHNLVLNTFYDGIKTLKDETGQAATILSELGVQIPSARYFKINRGYVIAQDYIEEDESVDIEVFKENNSLHTLIPDFDLHKSNFKSSHGVIYWVDQSMGISARMINSLPFVSYRQYRMIKKWFRSTFRLSRIKD